ncbi:MAG: HAMP domain-containing protein [Betaproteobacteria bacterium]|nr:HAMP domain-containing protein [Betaproteobacteria bacterium]
MGRLFWKFFFFIWLAQLTTIVGVSITFWLEHRAMDTKQAGIDRSPPAGFLVEAAAATLQYGGAPALRGLLGDVTQPKVYAVDEKNRELLGRKVDSAMIEQVRQALEAAPFPPAIRKVNGVDGHVYLLFLPLPGNRPDAGHPPNGRHPDGNGPPPPDGRHIPIEPILAAMLASLIFAALLAWYFSKPIRNLHSAFEAAATGNLAVRLGPAMGKRRDELADLGRDFDSMASHLFALMDGQRRLLHDVSHELRSPLARLQAAIGLARQQPEKLEAFLERIEREGVRMDKLVGELLTLSRLEAGVTGSMEEEINMAELVADVINDARFEAEAHGRTVAFTGSGEAVVRGNAELLHRAIENVIRNAVKHTPEGGNVTVDARLDARGHSLYLSVTDQGSGISEGDLREIFEPFFRGKEMTNSTDGHGLGLAISRRVVEAHGGTIRASNLVGGGLCVEIVLPVNLSHGND